MFIITRWCGIELIQTIQTYCLRTILITIFGSFGTSIIWG